MGRAALAGLVQGLLITRHMLFVGFSLNDDNCHRIADAVRRAVQHERFGSSLSVAGNRLLQAIWGRDLDWIELGDLPRSARLLEIFLDRLAARTVATANHLFDPRYEATLSPADVKLRDELSRLADFVASFPQADRQGAEWVEVERLLNRLGVACREGRDRFGSRLESRAAAVNAVLSGRPKTMKQIMREAGLEKTCYSHLGELVAAGLVVKTKQGFRLAGETEAGGEGRKTETRAEMIRKKALELLSTRPQGMRYSELVRAIHGAFPDIPVNTIHGRIVDWNRDPASAADVYKPAHGVFRAVKFREPEAGGEGKNAEDTCLHEKEEEAPERARQGLEQETTKEPTDFDLEAMTVLYNSPYFFSDPYEVEDVDTGSEFYQQRMDERDRLADAISHCRTYDDLPPESKQIYDRAKQSLDKVGISRIFGQSS
jgi:hypothetical protein